MNPLSYYPRLSECGSFQDWIVPLPGVHGSSLCILNFTAKKDKKRVKMDGFWEKCEKIVREGQKSEKNSSKKLREIFHELEGSNVSLLWQKNRQKIKRYVGCIARLPN